MTTRAVSICCGIVFLFAATLAAQTPAATEAYRLEPGDTIEARFFFNPELNDTVQIRPDGRISMQLVGELELGGKTIAEAVRIVQDAYARELQTPRVTLQVRSFAGRKVYVTGEVNRPGVVSLPGEMSVMGAIADAGGVRLTGNRKQVVLVRKGPDGLPVMKPLTLLAKGKLAPDAYLQLRAYDILLVPETRITRMDRWVEQYIKGLNPVNLSAGFTYLINKSSTGGLPF
jgi:protein involved in polysaccharide export with SLBB domain